MPYHYKITVALPNGDRNYRRVVLDNFHAACVAGLDDAFSGGGKLLGVEALPMPDPDDVDVSYGTPGMDLTLKEIWTVMRQARLATQSEAIGLLSKGFHAAAMALLEAEVSERLDLK